MGSTQVMRIEDLDAQLGELLPERETLFFDFNIAPVIAVNLAIAVNAATIGSTATALAAQYISAMQY